MMMVMMLNEIHRQHVQMSVQQSVGNVLKYT